MIPLNQPWYDHREEEAVVRVLRTGQLAGNGRECAALEEELAARLGVEYALAVSSGSHALEVAMELLEVRGGEVILPSFTFPSVANAVLRAGGRPVFGEIREPDLNIDLEHARNLVGERTKAVVVTHYAGHPCDFTNFPAPVIEDSAHALGSVLGEQPCGTIGQVGCLSFHQTKTCACGEGGVVLCASGEAVEKVSVLREKGTNREDFKEGRIPFYSWVGPGSSLVLPELSAAIARVQLAKLEEILSARRRIAGWYDQSFADVERQGEARIVRLLDGGNPSHHIYALLVDPFRRASILARMRSAGVEAAHHFVPLHSSPYGRRLNPGVNLPRTDRLAASIVRLPIYPGLEEESLEKVAREFKKALRSA
jgi:dTDP-4-amino-4,6-dideoxygalactose transaminase